MGETYPGRKKCKHLIHQLAVAKLPSPHHSAEDIAFDMLLLTLFNCELRSFLTKDVVKYLPQIPYLLREHGICLAGDLPHKPLRQHYREGEKQE